MMISKRIDQAIRSIKDFPKEGIVFKDITPILLDPQLCNDIADAFVERLNDVQIDAILAIESRGFLFGIPLAQRLQVPFIPIRKKGKLPGDTVLYAYDLEYGSAEIEMHKEDLPEGSKVLIHDDLLATGGTAAAAAELCKMRNATVAAYSFIVELDFLNGRKKLEPYSSNVVSLVNYK